MRGIRNHLRNNLVGYVALVVALGGTALAGDGPLPGQNKVGSADIINGEVKAADIGAGAVKSGKVADDAIVNAKVLDESLTGLDIANGSIAAADVANNSLTGEDIQESTLGTVPIATLGGLGRIARDQIGCNPETSSFETCAFVTLDLPSASRVLVIGTGIASTEADSNGQGECRIAANPGPDSAFGVANLNVYGETDDSFAVVGITSAVGPGPVDFGLQCNEHGGGIMYGEFGRAFEVAAVAISPS